MVNYNPVTYNKNINQYFYEPTRILVDVLDDAKLLRRHSNEGVLETAIIRLIKAVLFKYNIAVKYFDNATDTWYIAGFLPIHSQSLVNLKFEGILNDDMFTVARWINSTSYRMNIFNHHQYSRMYYHDDVAAFFYDATKFAELEPSVFDNLIEIELESSVFDNLTEIELDSHIEELEITSVVGGRNSALFISILKELFYRIYRDDTHHTIILGASCCSEYSNDFGKVIELNYQYNSFEPNSSDDPLFKMLPKLHLPLKLINPFIGTWHLAAISDYIKRSLPVKSNVRLTYPDVVATTIEQMLFQTLFDFNPETEFNLITTINDIAVNQQNEFI